MKIEGQQHLSGSPDELWTLLLDPDILVAAIPGCEKLERVGEDAYEGIIKAKVGPVQSQYTTSFTISDKAPPTSYQIHVQGQGPGGFVNGDVQISLAEQPAGTQMRYEGQAQVGGKIARVGQRMVQAAATMMVDKSLEALAERVEQELAPPVPEPAETAPARREVHPVPPPRALSPLARAAALVASTLAVGLLVRWLWRTLRD